MKRLLKVGEYIMSRTINMESEKQIINQNVDISGRDAKGWQSVIGCSIAIFWSGALIFGYPGVFRRILASNIGF